MEQDSETSRWPEMKLRPKCLNRREMKYLVLLYEVLRTENGATEPSFSESATDRAGSEYAHRFDDFSAFKHSLNSNREAAMKSDIGM